jgi:hypothetical protein
MRWAGNVALMGEKRNVYRLLVRKQKGKRPIGRPRRVYNIRMIPRISEDGMLILLSCFHSIMTYGLIFWDDSYHSNTVFKLQKRIVRIIPGIRDSHKKNISENYKYYHYSLNIHTYS